MRVRFRSRLVALDTKGSNGAHGGSRERIVTVRRFAVESGSLRTAVSVAGKRNIEARDKEAETASKVQGRHCRDKI